MKVFAWHRRRARLVLLAALLAVWACVLWSTGWTVADRGDARDAPVGSASAQPKAPAGSTPGRPGAAR